jgi:hypothetical protein
MDRGWIAGQRIGGGRVVRRADSALWSAWRQPAGGSSRHLGSCYFHASIAALAKATPDKLRAAIRDNPGGGYRVRFVDGPEEIVSTR